MSYNIFSDETVKEIKGFGRPVAGWFCTYTPLEILDAAGYTPVRIGGEHTATGKADSIMHTNICPYIKSCLEAAEDGKLDFISAAVFTNGCDAQRRLFDVLRSRKPNMPSYLISVPKKNDPSGIARFTEEVSDFRKWAEKIAGRTISDETLADSTALYIYLRSKLRGLDGARRKNLPTLDGSRALEIMLAVQRMPAREAIKFILEEEEKIRHHPALRGPKVLLSGNMLDDPDLIRVIEKYGARVFADDLCTGRRFWYMPEPKQDISPVEALAAAYLLKPPCPRMAGGDDSVSEMKKLVENLRPEGVIFSILKFCDTHLYNIPYMRMMLQNAGVKSLFIESDYTAGAGQAETRIQAFVEMLKEERGG